MDTSLVKIAYLKSACLELTNRCNLRCTYCTVSQPGYAGSVMSDEMVKASLTGLRRMRADSVALNGHGETTTLTGWSRVSSEIEEWGARVHLTSNFARPFEPGEVDALSRLTSIVVSLDTDDAELLRRTRRSVDLDVILNNVFSIKWAATSRYRRPPKFIASCVVHTLNVMHLDRFVRFALRNGFDGFSFCNLNLPPELPGAVELDHVASLPPDQLTRARQKILDARGIALSRGASVEIQAGLLDSIEAVLGGEDVASSAVVLKKVRHFKRLEAGETRRCLDPWTFVLIQADGAVRPCCWHPPVGNLEKESLEEISNGEAVVALRERLMTGELDEFCATCPTRPALGLTSYQTLLEQEIPRSPVRCQLARAAICARQTLRRVYAFRLHGARAPKRSDAAVLR